MANKKQKYPVRSIRISDRVFNKIQQKKKRGTSWDKFLEENYAKDKD